MIVTYQELSDRLEAVLCAVPKFAAHESLDAWLNRLGEWDKLRIQTLLAHRRDEPLVEQNNKL